MGKDTQGVKIRKDGVKDLMKSMKPLRLTWAGKLGVGGDLRN